MRTLCETDDCQRLAGHSGDHMPVEYREIKHHDIHQVARNMTAQAKAGAMCLQSWTCDGCGAVQRMEQSNAIFAEGECENCGHVTNLMKKGCNFTLLMPAGGTQRSQIRKLIQELGYKAPRDN